MPGEEVAEPSARYCPETAEKVWDCGNKPYPGDAHVAFVFQVVRQPTGVQPKRIDRPRETGDHAPGGSVSEELLPFGKGWRFRGGVLVALRQITNLVRSQANLRWIAVDAPP